MVLSLNLYRMLVLRRCICKILAPRVYIGVDVENFVETRLSKIHLNASQQVHLILELYLIVVESCRFFTHG